MKAALKTAIALVILCFGCHAYAQNTSSIAPGSLKEVPADIVTYLEGKGIFEFFSYDKNKQAKVRKSLIELQKYSDGKRKFYPAEDIKRLLTSMQSIIIDRDLHSGEKFVNNHVAFYSLLDIAINLCPDINLLAKHCSSDHAVGIIDFPDNFMGIFYHTLMCKVGENKFKAHTLYLPNEVEGDGYDKIRRISVKDGVKTYIISNEIHFDVYVLTIGSNNKISSTKPANENEVKKWFDEKHENCDEQTNTSIIFNPKKVCWEFCYPSGNVYKRVEGTKALYLEFPNGKPTYILKQ